VTVSSSDYVNWLYSYRNSAVCVGGVYYIGDEYDRGRGKRVTRVDICVDRGSRDTFVELIGRVERPVSLVEFSVRKRERDDLRIGKYLCKYSDAEPSINII